MSTDVSMRFSTITAAGLPRAIATSVDASKPFTVFLLDGKEHTRTRPVLNGSTVIWDTQHVATITAGKRREIELQVEVRDRDDQGLEVVLGRGIIRLPAWHREKPTGRQETLVLAATVDRKLCQSMFTVTVELAGGGYFGPSLLYSPLCNGLASSCELQ